ncbi:MAG: UDP-N-acetylmuramoyl-tripeptide--D-alanyl-D-alanine ligase [Verrucomicrobia bacterium]|nr:UDP-N-acetylmuramoyl-tripeptide--D-alanyl-D-alanine ligase [Verrucomicrobiota bacterium]
MKPLSISTLSDLAGADLIRGNGERVAFGVGIDSRSIKPGELFVAIRGPKHDGHDHVVEAAERGAIAALVQKREVGKLPSGFALLVVKDTQKALQQMARGYRRMLPVRVISVTGSSGKSSTKEMLAAVLGTMGQTHRTPGNLNNHFGVPLTLLGIGAEDMWAVVELAMNAPGEIGPLAELAGPEAGVVTHIGWAHVEGTGSREATAHEKGALYRTLPATGLAITNADDPFEKMTLEGCRARVVRVGRSSGADYRLQKIRCEGETTRFVCEGPRGKMEVSLPVPGAHMAMNAAQALAAGVELGAEPMAAAMALEKIRLPAGRLKLERLRQGWLMDDSYNANPDSLAAGLQTLQELPGDGRNVALLGAMAELGSFSRMLHEEAGAAVARGKIGLCLAVGEEARFLVEGAQKIRTGNWVRWFARRDELIRAYEAESIGSDRILVKGSRREGMEVVAARLREGNK